MLLVDDGVELIGVDTGGALEREQDLLVSRTGLDAEHDLPSDRRRSSTMS